MLTALVGSLVLAAAPTTGPWMDLFDGKTLNGWKVHNGFAPYAVEDGAIVGRTAKGSPNTFLCTTREFADFELTFEVKVDNELNSGVQFRSRDRLDDSGKAVDFVGPQVEIMAGPARAGFVWGEGTELGWLNPEPNSPDPKVNAHNHFKNEEWNQYRLKAVGSHVQTWINGQKIADFRHEEAYRRFPKGIIGLQVHAHTPEGGPFEVRWRNLRLREIKP